MIEREPIYAALFGLLAGAADFATTSRRMRPWGSLSAAEQPALFMRPKAEHAIFVTLGAPPVWRLVVEVEVYVHVSNPYVAPMTVLNSLIDAVEAALVSSPATGMQNLGLPEMVKHAYIVGKIEIDEVNDQAFATIPVEILCLQGPV